MMVYPRELYPLMVTRPDPAFRPIFVEAKGDEIPDPQVLRTIQTIVHCGPAATEPRLPTADEWFLGLVRAGRL